MRGHVVTHIFSQIHAWRRVLDRGLQAHFDTVDGAQQRGQTLAGVELRRTSVRGSAAGQVQPAVADEAAIEKTRKLRNFLV